MKYLIIAILVAVCSVSGRNEASAQSTATVSFNVFYDELSPYGVWIQDPQYGYIWVPDAPTGFQPYYTNGNWVMTEYGNTWVSGYSWGWAPFHYGRWLYDGYYGWIWVPGYDWGPAWVYWRYGGGYYGWAPLSPGFVVTAGFGVYNCPVDWWIFLPPKYLYRRHFTHHVRDRRQNLTIYNQTTVINSTYINHPRNTTYITGPTRDDYRKTSGKEVTVHQVRDADARMGTYTRNKEVYMYRPEVSRGEETVAPRNVINTSRPVSAPAPVRTNENGPAPFIKEIERSRPIVPERTEPVRTPQRTEPVRIPQRTEPVRTPQRTDPVRIPQRTEPVRTPQRTEPVRTPQRTEPVRTPQRAEPVRAPQGAEPAKQAPQRSR